MTEDNNKRQQKTITIKFVRQRDTRKNTRKRYKKVVRKARTFRRSTEEWWRDLAEKARMETHDMREAGETEDRKGLKRKREQKSSTKIKKKSHEIRKKRIQESRMRNQESEKKSEVVDRERMNADSRSLPAGPVISEAKKKWRDLMGKMQSSQRSAHAPKTKPRSKPRDNKCNTGKNSMLIRNKWGFLQVEKSVKANANGKFKFKVINNKQIPADEQLR